MKNGHYRAMPLIVSIVIVVAAVAFLSLQRTSFSDALAAITALVGILAIWFQMKRAKDMEEGSFIVGINDSFQGKADDPTARRAFARATETTRPCGNTL